SSEGPTPTSDPENRFLSHMNRQRLDFEAIHDYLLAASGELNCKMGGHGAKLFTRPTPGCRAVYGYIDRQFLPPVYRTFDFANPDLHTPGRHLTTVPQQSLFFMNSPFVIERAQALTANIERDEAGVRALYKALFQRDPCETEVRRALDFVKGIPSPPPSPTNAPPVWQYGTAEIDDAGL